MRLEKGGEIQAALLRLIVFLCLGDKRAQINPFLNKTPLMHTLSGNSSAERPGDVLALTAEADTCTVDCELRVIIRWHPKCRAVQGPAAQEHPFCASL